MCIYIYIGLLLASCSCGFAKSYGGFLAQCDAGYQQKPTGVDLHIVPRGNGGSSPLLQLPRIACLTDCSYRISSPATATPPP